MANLSNWGGPRPNSGRPKGRQNRRPRANTSARVLHSRLEEMAAQARAEAHELPVARLIRRLNDTTLDEKYRDTLAIAVAPYCSPRLNALAIVKRPSQWSDEELTRVLGMTEEDLLRLGDGRDRWPVEVPEVLDAKR